MPLHCFQVIPSEARLYLHSIELFHGGHGTTEATGALGCFSLTGHATATKLTAVLYHIERTQGLDKVRLSF